MGFKYIQFKLIIGIAMIVFLMFSGFLFLTEIYHNIYNYTENKAFLVCRMEKLENNWFGSKTEKCYYMAPSVYKVSFLKMLVISLKKW